MDLVSLHYIIYMDDSQKSSNAICPECDTPIIMPANFQIGKVVECPACGIQSEIININPLKLAPLEEEK